MTGLIKLAERCEKATGPDAELDMLIDCALKGIEVVYPTEGSGGRIESSDFMLLGWITPGKINRNFSAYGGYPAFTASLDAAMTLVPEGWRVGNIGETVIEGHDPWSVRLLEKRFDGRAKCAQGDAASAALALCAAALRARAAINE